MEEFPIKITSYEYKTVTSFKFYSRILSDLREFYQRKNPELIPCFSFLESCYIDPSVLPLIISLGDTLRRFHKKPIKLLLNNIPGTSSNALVNFLEKSDFFYLVGKNRNPLFPIGRDIFDFNEDMLGWNVSGVQVRNEHRVRGYSKSDLAFVPLNSLPEDYLRDKLIEHFSYVVSEEFDSIFEDNEITSQKKRDFIDYLSELITNSLVHSHSDCYVSLHTNRYRTAISISDIGIGLHESIRRKTQQDQFYRFQDLYKSLERVSKVHLSDRMKEHAYSIFEALYYSCLKDRKGLFDLMCSIVIDGHGVMRIHNYSAQLIISSKVFHEVKNLYDIRKQIYKQAYLIKNEGYGRENNNNDDLQKLSALAKEAFITLFTKVLNSYSNDIQLSPIRFFDIEFKGVHIETELPR